MSIRVNVAYSKKLGLPSYGSLGASCSIEAEVDSGLISGKSDRLQQRLEQLYSACAHAVEAELQRHREREVIGAADNGGAANSNGTHQASPRRATPSQVRAIRAIASHESLELAELLQKRFGVSDASKLSVEAASTIIDELKSLQAARQ